MPFSGNEFAWQFLILLGCLSGFISGLLGIGGGTILVPALIFGLPFVGVSGPEVPKIAMATSLALVIPTSIASAQTHASKGAVDWRLLLLLGPSIVAGAFVAAVFAHGISAQLLTAMFVLFALHTALALLGRNKPRSASRVTTAKQPGLIRITATGIAGGALSSLLGLGVSFFSVPILSRFVPMQRAIGTAAALCLPMAIAGVIGYLLSDTPQSCLSGCGGYIYFPAVAAIGITAVLTAPMGAVLTHILPITLLRNLFGLFLIAAAANLTYKVLPIAAATHEAQHVIAQLLAPPVDRMPAAAEAPSWLNSGRDRSYVALVAQYGPRRAFLPFASPAAEGAPDAATFFLSSTPTPDIWRAALAVPPQLKVPDVPELMFIDLPERAIRPVQPVKVKRKPVDNLKRRQPTAIAAKPAPPALTCADAERARSGAAKPQNGAHARPNCPPADKLPAFNPFAFVTAPGAEGTNLNWSQ